MGCNSGADQGPLLNRQAAQNQRTNAAVTGVQNAFSGFTPNFYQGIANAYQNYAYPQLQQQQRTATNNFGFQMADQGLQRSTQAQQGYQTIQDQANRAKTAVAQQGQQLVNQQKQQVAGQENNLISMAQAANNPGQMAIQAQATAAGLTAPSPLTPLMNYFSNPTGAQPSDPQQQQFQQQLQGLLSYYNTNQLGSGYGGTPATQ
jgi:hypothetical protein